MYKARKVDSNQAQIVAGLRQLGISVQSLASIGNGCPDLLIGLTSLDHRCNLLLEIKDNQKSPCRQKLNLLQELWRKEWRGNYFVVTSLSDAVKIINGVRRGKTMQVLQKEIQS